MRGEKASFFAAKAAMKAKPKAANSTGLEPKVRCERPLTPPGLSFPSLAFYRRQEEDAGLANIKQVWPLRLEIGAVPASIGEL